MYIYMYVYIIYTYIYALYIYMLHRWAEVFCSILLVARAVRTLYGGL